MFENKSDLNDPIDFTFIDLFAGLGGFHLALSQLGGKCVFASEKKVILQELYEDNFGLKPVGDITKVDVHEIPSHDVLCAGFPCQPFSKAGRQQGLRDRNNGYLFDVIVDILEYHSPNYVILENVRNILKHEGGKTLKYIVNSLEDRLGYDIDYKILSPHEFGIPHHRERFFLVASKTGLKNFTWPKKNLHLSNSITEVIIEDDGSSPRLEAEKMHVLDVWQDFLDRIPKNIPLPGPLWSMEFGADYQFENTTPFVTSSWALGKMKGSFGVELKGLSRIDKFSALPSYARTKQSVFPQWKQNFIKKNRVFYDMYGHLFSDLIDDIKNFGVSSWQKLEWNLKGDERIIKSNLVQFRGSGVRVKRTNYFPSLVTVSTQIPIITWEGRYITKCEGARLQGMEALKMPEGYQYTFAALGNAVNVDVVKKIAANLLVKDSKFLVSSQLTFSLS